MLLQPQPPSLLPQEQFVAAKSLIEVTSKIFIYSIVYGAKITWLQKIEFFLNKNETEFAYAIADTLSLGTQHSGTKL